MQNAARSIFCAIRPWLLLLALAYVSIGNASAANQWYYQAYGKAGTTNGNIIIASPAEVQSMRANRVTLTPITSSADTTVSGGVSAGGLTLTPQSSYAQSVGASLAAAPVIDAVTGTQLPAKVFGSIAAGSAVNAAMGALAVAQAAQFGWTVGTAINNWLQDAGVQQVSPGVYQKMQVPSGIGSGVYVTVSWPKVGFSTGQAACEYMSAHSSGYSVSYVALTQGNHIGYCFNNFLGVWDYVNIANTCADGSTPNANYSCGTSTYTPATSDQVSALLIAKGITSDIVKQLIDSGYLPSVSNQQVQGPAVIQGPQTQTQQKAADGTVQNSTTNTTYNVTYQGNTYNVTRTDNTTNNTTGASTTTTFTPQAPKSNCANDSGTIGCSSYGTPTASDKLGKDSREITISPVDFQSASCPAPVVFHIFGAEYRFSYDTACAKLAYVAPLLSVLAFVMAAWIFVGGLKA